MLNNNSCARAELLLYLSNIYEGLASHSLNIRYICTAHCKNAGTMLKPTPMMYILDLKGIS